MAQSWRTTTTTMVTMAEGMMAEKPWAIMGGTPSGILISRPLLMTRL